MLAIMMRWERLAILKKVASNYKGGLCHAIIKHYGAINKSFIRVTYSWGLVPPPVSPPSHFPPFHVA